MALELKLLRYHEDTDYTLGQLKDENGEYFSHTLEDEFRAKKVMHETRIPDGRYKLIYNPVVTGMTAKYRKKFDWFEYHIQLSNVPGFSGIYIHIGNTDDDTSGCILLGIAPAGQAKNMIVNSTITFKKFYKKYYPLIKEGKEIYLNVITLTK